MSPCPRRRRTTACASASRAASPAPPLTDAFANYIERRRGLLSGIVDGLDEHVRRMEARARDAVAHASAVAAASREQEQECVAALLKLEERVSDLQRAKRTCAAELEEFQATAAATRRSLTQELTELRSSVAAARQEVAAAQEAQRHHAALREAEERRHALAEARLRGATAEVGARFQDAVAALQVEVEARKRWADAQCAMHERRVREAAMQAEQNEFSAFLHRATHDAEAQAASVPSGVGVKELLHTWQREAEALATSAAARIGALVEQQRSAESEACNAQLPAAKLDRGCESRRDAADDRDAPRPASGASSLCAEASTKRATERHVPPAGPAAPPSPHSTRSTGVSATSPRSPADATAGHTARHLQAATASVNDDAAPSPSPSRALLDTPLKVSAHPPSSAQSSPRRHSDSPAFPERRLIQELHRSTDAFAAMSTPHKQGCD